MTTAAGAPVLSAYVFTSSGSWARAGDDGRFRIVVAPGAQRLAAYAEGHPPSELHLVVPGPGQSIGGLELSLGIAGSADPGRDRR